MAMKFENMVFYWVRNSEMKMDYEINDETALKEDYKKVYLVGPVNMLVGGLEKEILEKEESNKRYVGQLILALKTKDNEIAELCLERDDNKKAIDELNAENRKLKRALWLARANRALEKISWFKLWNASISTMNPEDGAKQEYDKWKKALGKFLAKAKEYK